MQWLLFIVTIDNKIRNKKLMVQTPGKFKGEATRSIINVNYKFYMHANKTASSATSQAI